MYNCANNDRKIVALNRNFEHLVIVSNKIPSDLVIIDNIRDLKG